MRIIRSFAGLALIAACGTSSKSAARPEPDDFRCRDRSARYVVTGSLAAAEVGVQLDCATLGPRILRWTVTAEGNREELEGSLGTTEFNRLWDKIDSVGWRYLKDCQGTDQAGDPVYSFQVADGDVTGAFRCTNAGPLPYPYNTFVDELDFKAAALAPADVDPADREGR